MPTVQYATTYTKPVQVNTGGSRDTHTGDTPGSMPGSHIQWKPWHTPTAADRKGSLRPQTHSLTHSLTHTHTRMTNPTGTGADRKVKFE